ncbi:MAG: hypothetical protein LBK53_05665 [Heliobacteriaceae bacterium]|jgi:hypothetical protein|nr:hypothetical protein [Heliobacteriaceae bacterium]
MISAVSKVSFSGDFDPGRPGKYSGGPRSEQPAEYKKSNTGKIVGGVIGVLVAAALALGITKTVKGDKWVKIIKAGEEKLSVGDKLKNFGLSIGEAVEKIYKWALPKKAAK